MMKSFFVALFILPVLSFAEPRAYIQESYWKQRVVVDGKLLSVGFLGRWGSIKGNMTSNPEAEAFASRAHTYAAVSAGFVWTGLIWATTYALTVPRDEFSGATYYGVLLGGLIPAIFIHRQAEVEFNRAINSYNGVSTTKSSMHVSPLIAPLRDGATLGMALSF